jgi:hypothetical protein
MVLIHKERAVIKDAVKVGTSSNNHETFPIDTAFQAAIRARFLYYILLEQRG